MADYKDWMKHCVYRHVDRTDLALYQGVGPGKTAYIFYGLPELDEVQLARCFTRYGGVYGQKVEWLFQQRGQILVSKYQSGIDENVLVLEGMSAGAQDVCFDDGDLVEIVTKANRMQSVADILEMEDILQLRTSLIYEPREWIAIHEDAVIIAILKFLDEVLSMDSIVNFTANFWILDEKLEKFV